MKTIAQVVNAINAVGGGIIDHGEDGIAFRLPQGLRVIFSWGMDWEHASISRTNRMPTWTEMCFVKNLLWADEENCMQLHPAKADYINNHQYCLHIWRPTEIEIPMPPVCMV